jgi:hypothetical protein
MAALTVALALVIAAEPAARPWICARNFSLGGSEGQSVQSIGPSGSISAVSVQVWSRGAGGARLQWEVQPGRRFAPPRYFSWEMEIEPPTELLWRRYWGDGRYLGQEILVLPQYLGRIPDQRLWSVSTSNPEILAGWMATERWEVELVNGAGATVARETVPLPPPSALRAAIESEIDWLESVVRTRAEPCHEEPDPDSEI